jgi:hypothetical protein
MGPPVDATEFVTYTDYNPTIRDIYMRLGNIERQIGVAPY